MANPTFGGDFEALAREYWNSWGEMMRDAAKPSQPKAPDWNDAVGWWSGLASQLASQPGRGGGNEMDEAVQRFNSQARGWFGQMQQLAAQFAGQDAGAAQIADAWKRMLGSGGGNPFAEVLRGMGGRGQAGPEQWFEQAAPYIEGLQRQGSQWLGTPAFGFAREHQERWQKLAQAQLDFQQRDQAYNALLGEAGQAAFALFQEKLAQRGESGQTLDSARALFDLWIDAAEEAYAEVALSPRFREAYGDMINAQMRLRAAVQGEVEQAGLLLGTPTRTEVDSAHRKIVQLEREMRRLRDRLEAGGDASAGKSAEHPRAHRDPDASPRPAPARRGGTSETRTAPAKVAKKSSARKTTKKAPAKKVPAKKAAAKKAAAKRTVKKTPQRKR
ncbi:class III poly(R)-hydroxyalkanoic acid synthase subunit PhaE [Lysobacter sp. D1-1-M9]|uniref:class III poly(R)-hydroxyalkanoic acid synthase subunit PhaE n=2 Tax=Novilysobacter TaxID=3382699 RepID=UPI002FCB7187